MKPNQISNLRAFIGNPNLSDEQVINYRDGAQQLVDAAKKSGLLYCERTETRPPKSVLSLIAAAKESGIDIDPALLRWWQNGGLRSTIENLQAGKIKIEY